MKRRVLAAGAVVLAVLGALAVRVVVEGRAALAEGDAAIEQQRVADAIAAWETAARWYLPGAPHVDDAYDRLVEHARARRNIAAWRAVRRAALATRSLWTPHADELAEANAAIAELAAADPEAALAIDDVARRKPWHEARLAAPTGPDRTWAGVAVFGILAWLVGALLLVRGGRTVPASAIAAAGVVAWALGLYSA